MFEVGDRVRVSYNGADAQDLRNKGIDTEFDGTIYEAHGVAPMYRVTPDHGLSPFDDDDTWYVWEQELEALPA